MEKHRENVCALLRQHTGLASIAWRPALDMLREEGCEPTAAAAAEGGAEESSEDAAAPAPSGAAGADAPPEVAIVTENGLRFAASLFGQKTGYYADQRDSRAVVRQLAAGRKVLDLYCYSGGFALAAAAGGAAATLGVDSSGAAVELAGRNAALNGLEGVAAFLRADAAEFMKEVGGWHAQSAAGCAWGRSARAAAGAASASSNPAPHLPPCPAPQAVAAKRRWDLVVLDPPKLAPNRKSLERATRKYRRLNSLAMQVGGRWADGRVWE